MKKLRLRSWVKVTMIIIAIVGMLSLLKSQQDKAIESCINYGNTIEYCEVVTR